MDIAEAQRLNDLTSAFYAQVEASFSATRQSPWQGWERVRAHALEHDPTTLSVLDLACGNLRFERYLAQSVPALRAYALDNCDALVHAPATPAPASPAPAPAPASPAPAPAGLTTTYQHLDIVQALLNNRDLSALIDAPPCDLAVCFGFMHHIALPEHRARVLQALVSHTRPGGLVAVSFWQFARSPRILAKAQALNDPGDFLLGWQNRTDVHRYCHSFSDAEVHELVHSLGPQVRACEHFHADGRGRKLNHYTILRIA